MSRFEKGSRIPTKVQVIQLAGILDMNATELLTLRMAERLIKELNYEPYAINALQLAEEQIRFTSQKHKSSISGRLKSS